MIWFLIISIITCNIVVISLVIKKSIANISNVRNIRQYLTDMGIIKVKNTISVNKSGTTRYKNQLVDDLVKDVLDSGVFGRLLVNNRFRIIGNKSTSTYRPSEYSKVLKWLTLFCELCKQHEPLFFMVIKYQNKTYRHNHEWVGECKSNIDPVMFNKWAISICKHFIDIEDSIDVNDMVIIKQLYDYYSKPMKALSEKLVENKQREIYSMFSTDTVMIIKDDSVHNKYIKGDKDVQV